jgi:DNA mismatch repair ATPase MutS
MVEFANYVTLIEATLDLKQVQQNHLYLINSSYEPNLQELRDTLDEVDAKVAKLGDEIGKTCSMAVKVESNAQSGYYFRVSRKVSSFSDLHKLTQLV